MNLCVSICTSHESTCMLECIHMHVVVYPHACGCVSMCPLPCTWLYIYMHVAGYNLFAQNLSYPSVHLPSFPQKHKPLLQLTLGRVWSPHCSLLLQSSHNRQPTDRALCCFSVGDVEKYPVNSSELEYSEPTKQSNIYNLNS